MQESCKILEVKKTRTSPMNPKCNGHAKRFNRTLIGMIKSYLRGEQIKWNITLDCLEWSYRSSPNESTGLTPNLMMLGREVTLTFEIIKQGKSITGGEESEKEAAHTLKIRERMQRAHVVARKILEVNAKKRKDFYDIKAKLNSYAEYDKVWYLNESRNHSPCTSDHA